MIMNQIHLDEDIKSLSDFRANAASYIEKVKSENRPLILTQHGKSSVVVIDVKDYQKLLDKIELLEEITTAKKEIENGAGKDHDMFMSDLRSEYTP
jgi:prevent-host-death family protein